MKVRVAHARCTLGDVGKVVDVDAAAARSLIRTGMVVPVPKPKGNESTTHEPKPKARKRASRKADG